MIFSSSLFLLYFLPIFLFLYHIVSNKLKNYVILGASIFFYSWGAPKFIFVIISSTIIDFYIIKRMHKSKKERNRKILLSISIFINLGLLFYFKYSNFFIENINSLLSSLHVENIKWTQIALPIGISFYTFQTLTYSIDVYRKVHRPLKKASNYLLYIMSFPQMIAGPIVRFHTIANQIEYRKETIDEKLIGFYRFSIGLAKKVLIANVMGEQANAIMNQNFVELDSLNAWIGIIAFTFQIYFDFSGYSDMAIGLGKMMGFSFPENFNSPYSSSSITEFWRKWHITLGAFMRDYLYIPLGGNRVSSKSRLYFNLWFVFLLSGLWHGASWNFFLWGAYHGFFLILDRLFLKKILNSIGKFFSVLITFFIVVIGWVSFRLENINDMMIYLSKMFLFSDLTIPNTIPSFYTVLIIAILFSFITCLKFGKSLEKYMFSKKKYSNKEHLLLTFLCLNLFILSISSITSSGFNPFIYFRF